MKKRQSKRARIEQLSYLRAVKKNLEVCKYLVNKYGFELGD